MPKVPYSYEVNGKLVTENGSLVPICSLSNCSLLPSLTVIGFHLHWICSAKVCFFFGIHVLPIIRQNVKSLANISTLNMNEKLGHYESKH